MANAIADAKAGTVSVLCNLWIDRLDVDCQPCIANWPHGQLDSCPRSYPSSCKANIFLCCGSLELLEAIYFQIENGCKGRFWPCSDRCIHCRCASIWLLPCVFLGMPIVMEVLGAIAVQQWQPYDWIGGRGHTNNLRSEQGCEKSGNRGPFSSASSETTEQVLYGPRCAGVHCDGCQGTQQSGYAMAVVVRCALALFQHEGREPLRET